MPYKRRPARKGAKRRPYNMRKKRTNKAKKQWLARKSTIVPTPGIADSTFVKLKFCDQFTFAANSSAPAYHQIRGNGPYDPQVAVGGSSCSFWSRYSSIYSRYRCYGSKIKVTFMNNGAGGSYPAYHQICAVIPAPAEETLTSLAATDIMERRRSRYKIVPIGPGGAVRTISAYASTSSILGVSKRVVDTDDQYQAATTGTPQREWYWNIFNQTQDETNPSAASCIVQVTYYVKFSLPTTFSVS